MSAFFNLQTSCNPPIQNNKHSPASLSNKAFIFLGLMTLFSLSACQVVSVKQQTIAVSLSNERDNVLTRSRLSEASLNVLSMTGQNPELCINDPYTCLKQLRQVSEVNDEQYLSTGSELFISRLDQVKQNNACVSPLEPAPYFTQLDGLGSKIVRPVYTEPVIDLKPYYHCVAQQEKLLSDTIRYAYAYLFFSSRDPKTRLFDNRQVQVRDFYNTALINLAKIESNNSKNEYYYDVPPELDSGKFHLRFFLSKNGQEDSSLKLESSTKANEVIAAAELNFFGLRSINRRDGFGADFVAILPDEVENPQPETNSYKLDSENLKSNQKAQSTENIHPARYLPVTITAIPRGNSIDEIINSKDIDFEVYNPYDYDKTKIGDTEYPLSANFSASYGLWIARTDLAAAAYLGLLARENRLVAPHLYMLEPYNPNKRIIIMVHGLASSPEAWIGLTHDVLGDQILRQHYQVWQVFYSTNMPILESRFQIHALIESAYNKVDPQHKNLASHQTV